MIINSYNHENTISACIDGILSQEGLPAPLDVILVDDGSSDTTVEIATSRLSVEDSHTWKSFVFPQKGGVYCRQFAIDNASNDLCLLVGGDFILTDHTVLLRMASLVKEDIAFASLYGPHGGMGTVYRKSLVQIVGGFDMAFNRFGSGYRDDSDLYYRLRDVGFKSFFQPALQHTYLHRQKVANGFGGAILYALGRIAIHELDVLLYKKHPVRFRDDFPMIANFFVDPRWDYLRASGRWRSRDKIELSSPQGVVLVEGHTFVSRLFVRLCAAMYAASLILVRLIGSLRYGTVLL